MGFHAVSSLVFWAKGQTLAAVCGETGGCDGVRGRELNEGIEMLQ